MWETMARRAHVKATGYNLWIYANLTGDWQTIETIQRQSRVTLTP
jgi:hypothetical protein